MSSQQCSISSPNTVIYSRQNHRDVRHNLTQKPEHQFNLGNRFRLIWASLLKFTIFFFSPPTSSNGEMLFLFKCIFPRTNNFSNKQVHIVIW